MRKVGRTIEVDELPVCDICTGRMLGLSNPQNDSTDVVRYDTALRMGPWANVCTRHWESAGVGTATKYVLKGGDK